ncbi:MAG: hypothetical protein ACXWTS_10225 [Methylococcaceae bacterium]
MFNDINDYRIIGSGPAIPDWHKRPRRLLLFLAVFLPLLAAAQIFIFLQPAVYSSKATVLTVAPADVDASSPNADPQHVIIQKQMLIGPSLLEQTAEFLKEKSGAVELTSDDLKSMLSVEPVPETNLVQLIAEGEQPRILQRAVNAWIEVYLKARAQYISETTEKVIAAINKELLLIEQQVEDKRKELEAFRMEHDILSEESSDNQAHARLQGLNQALNTALEEEVKTKAKLEIVRTAIAQRKAVVPDNDSQALADMMQRAQELREKVAGLQSQYTPEYIQLNPNLHIFTEQLAELEKKIGTKIKYGSSYATQEAENNFAAAHETVKKIKLQMDEHKQKVAEYTNQFAKYQAMQEELVKLEELQQKTKQRLIEIEVKQREQYPQVDVVEWASLPDKPIRPNYPLESSLAFAACLGMGLLAVWLADYLSREGSGQGGITLSGIYLYHDDFRRDTLDVQYERGKIFYEPVKVLQQDVPSELNQEDVAALFEAADEQITEILCLLFNGLSADEIVNLTADCFDLENRRINVPLRNRYVAMNRLTTALFTKESLQEWRHNITLGIQEIDTLLTCAAIDAGLPEPERINSEMVRFSYMLYLVKQGIKLSDLAKVFGLVSPARLVTLGRFSPEHAAIPIDVIDLDYPIGA